MQESNTSNVIMDKNSVQKPEEILPQTVEGIADEAQQGADGSKIHIPICHVGHLGGVPFVSGFSGVGDPVFRQRLVNGTATAILF